MPNITYDIIIVVALLLSGLWGYKKGLILTLCGFLTVFVALFGALYLSNQLAAPVGQLFQPAIEETLIDFVPDCQFGMSSAESTEYNPDLSMVLQALDELPLFKSLIEPIEQSLTTEGFSNAIHAVSSAIATQIARIVLFFLAFLAVMIAWIFTSRVLDLAFHLPVLSTLNAWSGFLIGLIRGLVLVFVVVWILKLGLLSSATVADTTILRYFYETSPMDILAELITSTTP